MSRDVVYDEKEINLCQSTNFPSLRVAMSAINNIYTLTNERILLFIDVYILAIIKSNSIYNVMDGS